MKKFVNVGLVLEDLGDIDSWSFGMQGIQNAFRKKMSVKTDNAYVPEMPKMAIRQTIKKMQAACQRMKRFLHSDMSTTTGYLSDESIERHVDWLNIDAQRKTFQCPRISTLDKKYTDKEVKRYHPHMMDALWLLNKHDLGVVMKNHTFAKNTYAAYMAQLAVDEDPSKVVPPTPLEGDRYNMMMCFARLAKQAFEVNLGARNKRRKEKKASPGAAAKEATVKKEKPEEELLFHTC